MYYPKTNLFTKFQVIISKDKNEKSRKRKCDRQSDGQTNGEEIRFPTENW